MAQPRRLDLRRGKVDTEIGSDLLDEVGKVVSIRIVFGDPSMLALISTCAPYVNDT
jgi:hypothetical protein